MRRVLFTFALVLVGCGLGTVAKADDVPPPPKIRKFYSSNRQYSVEITAKTRETRLRYPTAEFYVRAADGSYQRTAKFGLVNDLVPVSAIVSDDGRHLVTFDEWHYLGRGDRVVVIYRSNGHLVRKFALNDILTERDIETLPATVSSTWWGGTHYIDQTNSLLILKIVANRKYPWDEEVAFRELGIELATGTAKVPKRNLFPQPRVFVSDATAAVLETSGIPTNPVCTSSDKSFDSNDAVRVSTGELFAKAKALPLPAYHGLGRVAHPDGRIHVELVISPRGDVICARSLSRNPLFQGLTLLATLKWKFEPLETGAANRVGVLTVNFEMSKGDFDRESKRPN
jgi:hypothetical protein